MCAAIHSPCCLAVAVVLLAVSSPAGGQYGGGSGTVDDPYLICSAEQLNAIGLREEDWCRHFMLMADIDLSGYAGDQFHTIGRFTGVFEGSRHAISNFSCLRAGQTYAGLFEWLAHANAEIRNLVLIEPAVNVEMGDHVAALVGYLYKGTVTNCHVVGGRIMADRAVGGLVGSNMGGAITNCSSWCEVSGSESIGGLVGVNFGEAIANCHARGTVTGDEDVGGLAGTNYGTIANCYADAAVIGVNDVGGLVGHHGLVAICGSLRISMPGTISCCYNVGGVMGRTATGGLVGSNCCGDLDGCFWDVQTTGQAYPCGGHGSGNDLSEDDGGRITCEMQTAGTFLDAGWDFVGETANGTEDIWWIDEGQDYPRLRWEHLEEDTSE